MAKHIKDHGAAARARMIMDLEAQHEAFERTLADELTRPSPDAMLIRRLKRAKLALRDRAVVIAAATEGHQPAHPPR
ncbi:YdcH family protein [Elioraea sp.]|uniref:YdcH family protein n=1 Tax=Elioraea sp. TaxID=2185103 RepID=UPI0025B7BE64|nr:DUF465 domain-containing protein [Elioraea sp.]